MQIMTLLFAAFVLGESWGMLCVARYAGSCTEHDTASMLCVEYYTGISTRGHKGSHAVC